MARWGMPSYGQLTDEKFVFHALTLEHRGEAMVRLWTVRSNRHEATHHHPGFAQPSLERKHAQGFEAIRSVSHYLERALREPFT